MGWTLRSLPNLPILNYRSGKGTVCLEKEMELKLSGLGWFRESILCQSSHEIGLFVYHLVICGVK